jgi:hypothetical protein
VSHFGGEVKVDGNWVTGSSGEQVLGVGVAAPQPFETKTGDNGRPFVEIRPADNVNNVRFINVLYPTTHEAWGQRPNFSLLADSGQAAAVRVQWGESGRTDDTVIRYDGASGSMIVGPYETDARVAVVVRNGNGAVERLFVFGGTFLRDTTTGETLASGLDSNTPFESSSAQ